MLLPSLRAVLSSLSTITKSGGVFQVDIVHSALEHVVVQCCTGLHIPLRHHMHLVGGTNPHPHGPWPLI
jgi:hypothetical protein